MEYRRLGKLGPVVSVVGLGTGQFGARTWGYGVEYGDAEVKEIVHSAIEHGVTLIDTAETYGNGRSEELIGEAIKGYKRDDLTIITKVAPWNLAYDRVLQAAERSRVRLGVDAIDLYLIHYPNHFVPLKETFRAMERLVALGKIRYIGVSNFGRFMIGRAVESMPRSQIVADEIEYNLLSRRAEAFTIPFCKANGIGVVAFSPLAGGMLTGRFNSERLGPARARAFNFTNRRSFMEKASPLTREMKRVADSKGITVSQVALSFIAYHSEVTPIPCSLSVSESVQNSSLQRSALSPEEYKALDGLAVNVPLSSYLFDNYMVRPIAWMKGWAGQVVLN